MLRTIVSSLLIFLAYGAAFLISMPIGAMLKHLTGDRVVSNAVATGVWILSGTVLICYISLFSDRPPPPKPGFHQVRPPWKLESAALRLGLVFALVSGALGEIVNASSMTTGTVAVACAVVGGLIGYDVQRRARRLRTDRAPDRQNEP